MTTTPTCRSAQFRNHFDGGEPAVDEVRAVGERDVLPAATAARAEEGLGILIVVVVVGIGLVVASRRRDDLTGVERRPILDGDDTDRIGTGRILRLHRFWLLGYGHADDLFAAALSLGSPYRHCFGVLAELLDQRRADDDRPEAVDAAELLLPAHDRFEPAGLKVEAIPSSLMMTKCVLMA